MKKFKFLILLINSILTGSILADQNQQINRDKSQEIDVKYLNHIITFHNLTYISKLCDEGDINECYNKCIESINTINFIEKTNLESTDDKDLNIRQLKIDYNNILSEYYFYAGQIEYWGLISKKPKLIEGFSKFLISSFYGNPKAHYKIYIIIHTDILKLIIDTKDFEILKNSDNIIGRSLNYIFNTTNGSFSSNFYYDDDYQKNSVAMQFLYSSALYKYPPAMTALAYKFYKGYELPSNCKVALKYYKETADFNVKHITNRRKPNYYEKVNLESYEYIAHKFSNEIVDINHLIDYIKVEAENGQITYIQQLGQRYLYGHGIKQNFQEAFYYFEMGSRFNDSESIYYLGEMYLNGWGVEKVRNNLF